ncbi:MAG: hypothetical protein JST23_13680 [Bacteroidetes bacterium]|nr:hypothetical protein [Bacteroidota bacterium]
MISKKKLLIFWAILLLGCNSTNLGNGIYLLEGDRVEDRIIVRCSGKNYGECVSGSYLIPRSYNEHFDKNGHYLEYVENTTSNKKWVIAKTYHIQEKRENYWIINKDFVITDMDCSKANCDSIIQNLVTGPMNLTEFENKKKVLNIELNFK